MSAESDHAALQGFWKLVSTTADGKPIQGRNVGTIFRFVGNRFIHIRSRLSYRFELQADGHPEGFDLVLVGMRSRVRQLYELEGDTLRIQTNSLDLPRPTEFSHPVYLLETYKRFKRRLSVKRRVKAQVPAECVAEGIVPDGMTLSDMLRKRHD